MSFTFTRIDKDKAQEGVWMEYPDGSEHLLARSGTEAQQREMQRQMKRLRAKTMEDVPYHKQTPLLCRVMANTVILDWRNCYDANGKEAPFSKELAEQRLLEDDDYRSWVSEQSADKEAYYRDEVESAKNS